MIKLKNIMEKQEPINSSIPPEILKKFKELSNSTIMDSSESPLNLQTLERLYQLGYQVTGIIASGTRGTAYTLANGKVLKATDDLSEAQAALKIIKNPSPYIVTYYKIFELDPRKVPRRVNEPQYIIIQEKLKEISKIYEHWISKMDGYAKMIAGIPEIRNIKNPEEALKLFLRNVWEDIEEELNNDTSDKMKRKLLNTVIGGFLYLDSMGIYYDDIWYKNIMQSENGEVKLIDPGNSRGTTGTIPMYEKTKTIKLKELFNTNISNATTAPNQRYESAGDTIKFSLPDKDGNMLNYKILISRAGYEIQGEVMPIAYVEFFVKYQEQSELRYTQDIQNSAQPFKVFSIVWNLLQKYLDTHDYEIFAFSALNSETSRVKLYDEFSKIIDKKSKWHLAKTKDGLTDRTYYFSKNISALDFKKKND